ncbi:iron complex transport system substrate-binding protein [Homoserinimonas aerilata]|uniref:Iron complex transport system substrate-binding protein n=1 Tax=Homoserinimonas aerilata TaxID=1162970 RepID=A0A542YEY3_9MICO|nr:ABC transporter substrate-binding protein [Homoserinimonas aerilata]TQL46620.1 iron complex transport system substrate-binding protein [Homoserinimonas aerilata]
MKTLARSTALLLIPILAVSALAACSTGAGDDSSANAEGAWSYTDDTGRTVTLDEQPERIAAYSDYAVGLLSTGIDPVALFGRFDVDTDARFDDYDISETPIVGNSYGEIDLEALAETAPELIVVGIYPIDREGTLDTEGAYYGVADVEQQEQLEKIAPVVAIKVGGKGIDVVESMTNLALALGASEKLVEEGKAEYEIAAADLTAAAEESGVEVTYLYADPDGVYVTKTLDEPETELYSELGVNFTSLKTDGDFYWDIYSWENAEQMMTGDVLLVNNEGFQKDDLLDQPTFASHPALVAGQIHTWNSAALDYASQAVHMGQLAKILRESKQL